MSKLIEYTEISSFNENTVLVQKDNRLFVKKRISNNSKDNYKKLIGRKQRNVCEVYNVFEYEDSTIVIEEYVNGQTLSDVLGENQIQSEIYTKKIIAEVCDGLYFLHNMNIVHRDINPNNIMITSDGIVKIIDFGISRSVKKNTSHDTTVLGTVGYAAPEQFGFAQSDVRADIYAVGVLANVMLTSVLPNEKIYSGKLGKIIGRATGIDAKTRYKSIISFKHAFTNEVDESTNTFIKGLRCIPGFRTWVGWKMILSLYLYAIYFPLMVLFVIWSAKSIDTLIPIIISELLIFVIPYLLISNLFGLRDKLSSNRKTAVIAATAFSIISFLTGALIFVCTFGKIQ